MADHEASTSGFAGFSSRWRTGFWHLRGGSENQTVVHDCGRRHRLGRDALAQGRGNGVEATSRNGDLRHDDLTKPSRGQPVVSDVV